MLNNPNWKPTADDLAKLKPLEPWRLNLLKAADYMEVHGHCKHELWNKEGAVCLVGALYITNAMKVDVGDSAAARVGRYLKPDLEFSGGMFDHSRAVTAAVCWNNAPERTGEEVVAAMRATALEGIV